MRDFFRTQLYLRSEYLTAILKANKDRIFVKPYKIPDERTLFQSRFFMMESSKIFQNQHVFLRYIHNLRGLAILSIVVSHMVPFLDTSKYPLISSLLQIVGSNGSAYFIFIAGFLFQFLSKKYNYNTYLKNKFFNVVIPYILVSIPAICLCILRNQPFYKTTDLNSFGHWSLFQKIIYLYVTGSHLFHFWFIPVIIIFYLFAPIFIWLDRYPQHYKIALPFLICLSIVIPRASDDALVLQNFVHFISVYTLGMFCSHYQAILLLFMNKYWQFILMLAILLIGLEINLVSISSPLLNMIYINTASKSILSIVFMFLLWQFDSNLPTVFHKIVSKLANLSFGIYFIHAYIIYTYMFVLKYLNISIGSNIIFFTVSLAIVVLASIFVVSISQQILRKRSRYLLGC